MRTGKIGNMKLKQWWIDFLKGTTIGFAIPIPGVSGGTMAVLTGIFNKITDAVSNLKKNFKQSFKTLLPIGLGALVMAIIGLIGIKKGFESFPFALSALFAGLILGSIPVVTKELKNAKRDFWGFFRIFIGFVVAAGIGIASALVYYYYNFTIAQYLKSNVAWIYPVLLVAGFIAATAAVVPGISGSMMMFLMGLYMPIVSLFTTWSNWKDSSLYGVMFGGGLMLVIGGLAGFILTNIWMKKLLEIKHDQTYQVIVGFIFGSLISMFINPQMIKTETHTWVYESTPTWEWIVGSILFVVAAVALFIITTKINNTPKKPEVPEEQQN
jgi:putative membrane protein